MSTASTIREMDERARRLREQRAAEIDAVRKLRLENLNDPALVGIMLGEIAMALIAIKHELYDIDISIGEK